MKKLLLFVFVVLFTINANAKMAYPVIEDISTLKFLSDSELAQIFKGGNTIVGTNLKFKKEVVQNYHEDNTYTGTVASGKKKVGGNWIIENATICHIFKKKNKDKKKCRAVYKEGDFLVEVNKANSYKIMTFKLK